MKKLIVTTAVCALLSGAAMADQSPWMVRARAVGIDMSNNDATGLGLSVNNKTIPEIDISYFINKNVAVELILTVPQKQTVHSSALGTDIGTFKHLPPVVSLQYHFDTVYGIKPYVGAGVNYTLFTTSDILSGAASIDKSSWGGALQVGVDIPLGGNLFLNFDLKKVYIKTNVYVGAVNQGTFAVDPVLFGMGLGWRF